MNQKDIISLTMGILVLKLFTKILKYIIDQKRPNGLKGGMPSFLASYTMFFATYIYYTSTCNVTCKVCLFLFLLGTQYSKYYLREHSFNQLFVGNIIGFLFGLVVVKFQKLYLSYR